jgi:hypothetical protein
MIAIYLLQFWSQEAQNQWGCHLQKTSLLHHLMTEGRRAKECVRAQEREESQIHPFIWTHSITTHTLPQ